MAIRSLHRALQNSLLAVIAFVVPAFAFGQTSAPVAVKNIVLVHGAWADGSSWAKVIPLLQAKGFHVTAVQNPLTSFADDVAATKRIIDAQDGPVLLVGHSYGGAVITEAGNDSKVVGLVYVAAFGPDTGETLMTTGKDFAPGPATGELRPIQGGFVVLSPKGMSEDFCQDLPPAERDVMLAVQVPTAGSAFAAPISSAAWHAKPSWFVIAEHDRTINPDYERMVAKRMGARTLSLPTSHVAMLVQPGKVADFIASAASPSAGAPESK